MNKCIRCNKFLACDKASQDIEECTEYQKRDFDNE